MSEWKSPVADSSIRVCEGAGCQESARFNCQVKVIFFESDEIAVTFQNNLIIQNKNKILFVQSLFIFLDKRNFRISHYSQVRGDISLEITLVIFL